MNRILSKQEHDLILVLIKSLKPETAEILQSQLARTTVVGGKHTMLELSVDANTPAVEQDHGPLPVKALVNNDNGEPMGELLLWTTDGYLSQLEYAWYTEQMPETLPNVSQVLISMN